MNIGTYSYEEYLHLVKSFHGSQAPGLMIGGFMVDYAMNSLPEGEFFDAICETRVCLPDAVQILTPCTIGNGWLKVFDYGRYALALYEKYSGEGIRIYLDPAKLSQWSEVNGWFMKLIPKKDQDSEKLFHQIKEAGRAILSKHPIRVQPALLQKEKMGKVAVCPQCGEAYPVRDGAMCRPCAGDSPYVS
ncbi:MAG: formylmethanofuran dehydrogenase subunit E family protein [Deltaproteobacteria bacterium]|nr:formylmethanofuran dehydrogenase subunit E family protein [Deltaproteobacteria bacterium]